MDHIDNGMLIGAERDWAAMYTLDDTPWDLRRPDDLLRFAWDLELQDRILEQCGDEEQITGTLDGLPRGEAIALIESYIRINCLTDRYNAWKHAV